MKILVIVGVIISAIIGVTVIGFTNIDELVYPDVEEVVSQVEFDQSSVYQLTDNYPINTRCELALLGKEFLMSPLHDHTQWFYDKFGDLTKVVTDVYVNEMATDGVLTPKESERLDNLIEEYYNKINSRIKPSLRETLFPRLLSEDDLAKDPECAKIIKENFPNMVWASTKIDSNKNSETIILGGQFYWPIRAAISDLDLVKTEPYQSGDYNINTICEFALVSITNYYWPGKGSTLYVQKFGADELQKLYEPIEKKTEELKEECRDKPYYDQSSCGIELKEELQRLRAEYIDLTTPRINPKILEKLESRDDGFSFTLLYEDLAEDPQCSMKIKQAIE